MPFLAAAIDVLRTADRPLTSNEITREALARGFLVSIGKTPEASMSATLYMEAARGADSRVKRVFEPGRDRAKRGSVRWTVESSFEPRQAKAP
jgi:hypothetical protein